MSSHYVLFNISDIGKIPPTPLVSEVDDNLTPEATDVLIKFGNEFGFPISYKQEQNGRLIQNILPVFKTEYGQISTSSKNDLYLHTEAAFHPYRPSHVLLLCVRGSSSVATTIASIDKIMDKLDEETLSILKLPFFETGVDESFMSKNKTNFKLVTSVFRDTEDKIDQLRWTMVFDWLLMNGMNTEAKIAFEKLKNAVRDSIENVYLKTGDLIVIDNNRAVHGRTKFQPRYDGTDRWVKRLLTIKTMPPKAHVNGNVIVTEFNNG